MLVRLAALALVFAPAALAQPDDGAPPAQAGETVTGETVTVTASRLPGTLRTSGRDVTVITAADIARAPALSLDELLRFEAGVETVPRGGFGAQADLTLRGSTFNGVVLLVDGARFNDPMTGHFLSDFPIPLAEIARVEVLRGPAAAAWGPDALGGVVHVITHTAAGTGPRLAAEAVGGSATTGRLGLAARGGERAVVSGALDLAGTRGETIRDDAGAPVGGADPVRTDFRRAAATAAVSMPLGRTTVARRRLTARVAADVRDFGAFQFYTPFASDTAREATATLWAQAALAGTTRRGAGWRLGLAGRVHRDEYTYNATVPANEHTSRRLTATAEASRAVGPALRLGAGLSGELRGITSNNLGDHGDASGGAFATARWRRGALTATATARLDADAGFGVEATPSLALAARATDALTLRAAAGRAVRAPDYVERYFNTVNPRPDGNLGNPDLRAERALFAEGGADLDLAGATRLRATAFWRRTDDLIDYARLDAGAEFFLAQNVLRATTAGLELGAQTAARLAPDVALRLAAGYTFASDSLSGAADGAEYKYALRRSPHLAQARASLDAGRLRASLAGLYKARVDLDDYGWLDARLGLAVGRARQGLVYAELRNVADAEVAEVFGAPLPGRTWLVGVRLAPPGR